LNSPGTPSKRTSGAVVVGRKRPDELVDRALAAVVAVLLAQPMQDLDPGRSRSSQSHPSTRSAHVAVIDGRPTRRASRSSAVALVVTGASRSIGRTLRTETPVFAVTAP
jgi:hypothetical protein